MSSKYIVNEIQKSNIYIVDNAFEPELCDKLINYINNTTLEKLSFTSKNNVQCYNVVNIEENDTHNLIFSIIKKLFESIPNNDIKIKGHTLFELRKVYGETRLHQDGVFDTIIKSKNGDVRCVRSLTMVITLNDDFDGGIYTFPNQNITIKPKKGTAILFPPYYTHLHAVSCVENGKFRYICSCWGLDDFMIKEEENIVFDDDNANIYDNEKNTIENWSYKNFFIPTISNNQ